MPGMLWCSATQWRRVAEALGDLDEVHGVAERIPGLGALDDRGEVKYGEVGEAVPALHGASIPDAFPRWRQGTTHYRSAP